MTISQSLLDAQHDFRAAARAFYAAYASDASEPAVRVLLEVTRDLAAVRRFEDFLGVNDDPEVWKERGAALIQRIDRAQDEVGLRLTDYEQRFVDDFLANSRRMTERQMEFAEKLAARADHAVRRRA